MVEWSYRRETDCHQALLTVSMLSQLRYICSLSDIEHSLLICFIILIVHSHTTLIYVSSPQLSEIFFRHSQRRLVTISRLSDHQTKNETWSDNLIGEKLTVTKHRWLCLRSPNLNIYILSPIWALFIYRWRKL